MHLKNTIYLASKAEDRRNKWIKAVSSELGFKKSTSFS
jgi:hypothetical protein